ncbi:hypothetical protein B566_EDAN013929, partial [Ephemera danica]
REEVGQQRGRGGRYKKRCVPDPGFAWRVSGAQCRNTSAMDTNSMLVWLITMAITITTVTCEPPYRRRSQSPYAPPLHLFPHNHPSGQSHPGISPGRLAMHHAPPSRQPPPFKPLPYHPKLMRIPKYPPHHRPYPGGPKKQYYHKGPPLKYHGAPSRPTPYPRPQYEEHNDEHPKLTVATFVDKPKPSNLGTPILRYNGNKKPTVSYGPPYPPKPFKAYGVPSYDEEDEEQNDYPAVKYTEPNLQGKFSLQDQPNQYQQQQYQNQNQQYQNQQQQYQNQQYQNQQQATDLFSDDPIYSSVQSAATLNLPSLVSYQQPAAQNKPRRRRPQRQETQLGQPALNEQPREAPKQTQQAVHNYDDFLRETFTERSESLQPQETRRRRVRPSGRIRAPTRAANHQYEVTTEAEERKSDTEPEWQPSQVDAQVEWRR